MTLPIRFSRIRLSQGQLFWREVGQGETLVFLHGSWTDGSQWEPVIAHLDRQYHCMVPDLLGFGDSERPRCHYSIGLEVDCLAEYLATLRSHQVWIVGHSVGAWVAARYALQYPDRVKGLVLLEPEGVSIGEEQRWKIERWLMTRPPVLAACLQVLLPMARLFKRDHGIRQRLHLWQKLRRSPVACKLLFKRRRVEIQAEFLDECLGDLKTPMWILQSTSSHSAIAPQEDRYAQAPNAKIQFLDAPEDLVQTAPDRVAQEICAFVNQHLPLQLGVRV